VVGMSALLTTTMPGIEKTIKALKDAGVAAKVMIGGAPVTQGYADKIGADGYALRKLKNSRLIRLFFCARFW